MGVYFKGMKMPENCLNCDVNTDYNYCPILRRDTADIRYDKRFDDCPIVEVKEPHGRLVDQEDISKMIHNPYERREVMRWVDKAPTIIEAEGGK